MKRPHLAIPLNLEEMSFSEDMVAAAVYMEAGEVSHAVLLIHYTNETRIFHLHGSVRMEAVEDVTSEGLYVFIKRLDFIPPFIIPSFLAHCELIQKEARPEFGYFYNPKSFYDASGKFQNPGSFPEYYTCVGFCLTVIQSYLVNEEFLYYADWDTSTLDTDLERTARQMVDINRNYPNLKPEDLEKSVRRILPLEYLSGAYADTKPVRKSFTDRVSSQLKAEFLLLVA